MNLLPNQIFEWLEAEKPQRVLAILPEGDIVLFPLQGKAIKIERLPLQTIQTSLENGEARILTEDPASEKNLPENEIPDGHKSLRNKAWELIEPIVSLPAKDLFHKKRRWAAIKKQCEKTGTHPKVVYDALRKYWQGGQIKNALLPNYSKKANPTGGRRGRKPLGKTITSEDENKFELGIKAFYEKPTKPTLRDAYKRTIARYFNTGYEIRKGVTVPVIPPTEMLPTERQFIYWYKTQRDPERSLRAREGKRFMLKYRAIEGESTSMGFGPGSLYQIDSTVGDIYLVSTLNRATIVGRPTLYIVTDVFSRCIAGFNLTLEDPSYQQAALALENAIEEKPEYCKQYGLDIVPEEWPCQGVPESLLGDRGELKGNIADNIISGLGIRLDNTAPYRADMKGIVESTFRLGNQRLFHHLPGAVRKAKERGDKDPRLEARLDINQLTKLVIIWILDHNRRQLHDYPASVFQIADGVELSPISLWAWGQDSRTGALRSMPSETVRTHLLPQGEAGITPRGIHFRRAFYTCPMAIEEQWFVRAREGTRRKVKVCYDPRDTSVLYVRTSTGVQRCNLKEISEKFQARTWAEVQAYFYEQRTQETTQKADTLQREAEFQAQVKKIIVEAKDAFTDPKLPKTQRTKSIQSNRKTEAKRTKKAEPDSTPPTPKKEPAYIGPPSFIEILRKNKK